MDLEETATMVHSPPHDGRAIRRRSRIFPATDIQVNVAKDGSHLISTALRNRDDRTTYRLYLDADEDTDGESHVCSEVGCWTGYIDPFTSCRARHLFKSSHTKKLHSAARKLVGLHLFPLISRSAGEVWSSLVFLLSSLVFSLSLAALLLSPDEYGVTTSDIIKVSIGGVALVLSLANSMLSLRGCHVFRGLFHKFFRAQSGNDIEQEQLILEGESPEEDTPSPESRSVQCSRFFKDVVYDIFRLYLTEFLIYFNLAFSILDADKSIKDPRIGGILQGLKLTHLIVSATGFLLHVYITRFVTMATTFHSMRKSSRPSTARDQTETSSTAVVHHSNRGRCSFTFLCVFILIDMVAQGFAFASIWLKADCENHAGSSTHISGYTWAMLVVGAAMFMLGSATWYITAYFWVQEFLVHYMLGVLLKVKAAVSGEDRETHQKLDTIVTAVREDRRTDSIGCCRKLLFPLHTPRLILPSCLYFLVWASFLTLIFIGASEGGDVLICSRNIETGALFSITSAVIIFGNVASNLTNLPVIVVGGIWCVIVFACALFILLVGVAFLMLFLAAALPLVLFALYVCNQD